MPLVVIGDILSPVGRLVDRRGCGVKCSNTAGERGAARVLERATEASEAWMAKRGGRAVNGGLDGRRERPARGQGKPRAAGFTESADILSAFPGAE